jgi:hypothetical protein
MLARGDVLSLQRRLSMGERQLKQGAQSVFAFL